MENTPATQPVRILVVDDHPNTAATLSRALSQLGSDVTVTSAASGREALSKVKNSGVDILITDMIMPEMTGLELIEKMQSHPGGRPSHTYLVTAYDVPGLKVTAHRLKVNEVIIKPVRPERICQIVTQAINEMKQATQPRKAIVKGKRKFKILAADDKPDNLTLLTRYLEYEGYDQITAEDGLQALAKVQDEMPDLVLLDVNMPYKDGFAVLEEIRANPATEHIPVIILTAARLDPTDVQSGLNLGADDYVTKPFDRHELMARIRTKLRVKETEDVIRRRNRELNLLPEIGKELSARTDMNELINILLKRTVETLGAIEGCMVLFNDASNTVKKSYQIHVAMLEGELKPVAFENTLIDHVRETRQGVIIKNTLNNDLWLADETDPTRSAVVVPLFGRRTLLAILALTHEQENYFNLEHLLLLQAIASQAAIAIENASLYENVTQEQKQLERIKNEFIATASHDLKNPIMSINGYSDLLGKAGPLNTMQQEFVGHIQSSTKNMLGLVQNMLQLTEIDLQHIDEKHEPMNIAEILVEIVGECQIQAMEKNQTLKLENENTRLPFNGNTMHIRQAFQNLISNAIKYTQEDGNILVKTSVSENEIKVDVVDNGFGIPAADLPHIFDRFYRVHSGKVSEIEGHGLGLAIVKSLVEKHGGDIYVQSEEGKGSCFTLTLPALQYSTKKQASQV